MNELKVIGHSDGNLILADSNGVEFSLSADNALAHELQLLRRSASPSDKSSPREIQALIRSGLSAEEVAEQTGTTIERVRLFEGPVLAEREFVVAQAINSPAIFGDGLTVQGKTFGTFLAEKLNKTEDELLWDASKIDSTWTISLSFKDGDELRTGRWSFNPTLRTLTDLNEIAANLLRDNDRNEAIIPRLRVVEGDASEDHNAGQETFGQDNFEGRNAEQVVDLYATIHDAGTPIHAAEHIVTPPTVPHGQPLSRFDTGAFSRGNTGDLGVHRAPEPDDKSGNDTADLLASLRHRRENDTEKAEFAVDHEEYSEFELDEFFRESESDHPEFRPFDAENDNVGSSENTESALQTNENTTDSLGKRGRAHIPSWDDILFGAKSDSDPT